MLSVANVPLRRCCKRPVYFGARVRGTQFRSIRDLLSVGLFLPFGLSLRSFLERLGRVQLALSRDRDGVRASKNPNSKECPGNDKGEVGEITLEGEGPDPYR